MGVRTFPALGFDPAPGSPAALLAQAREADRAARALAGAAAAAGRLDARSHGAAGRWQGAAADAFRDHARELPGDLGRAAAAHGTLARELSAYAEALASASAACRGSGGAGGCAASPSRRRCAASAPRRRRCGRLRCGRAGPAVPAGPHAGNVGPYAGTAGAHAGTGAEADGRP